MGWLKRIFGQDVLIKSRNSQPQNTQQSAPGAIPEARTAPEIRTSPSATLSTEEPVPPERMGLNGEYDQSGLAKRVAQAFDEDPTLDDVETVWVAQTGSTVVLKGKVPNRQLLDRMISVARKVYGATSVDSRQIQIG
ncbi:MAG TPA: BON domain-containing protein [Leptolyngbyaceae cyanobacterium]